MFKLILTRLEPNRSSGFNLLSEILFVQAQRDVYLLASWWLFQSLERDSVCSSATWDAGAAADYGCFNLLSEILFVQAFNQSQYRGNEDRFQSLERDSVCSSAVVEMFLRQDAYVSIS